MRVPVFCSHGSIKTVDNLVSFSLSPPWRYHCVNLLQYTASFHCFDSVLSLRKRSRACHVRSKSQHTRALGLTYSESNAKKWRNLKSKTVYAYRVSRLRNKNNSFKYKPPSAVSILTFSIFPTPQSGALCDVCMLCAIIPLWHHVSMHMCFSSLIKSDSHLNYYVVK